VKQWPTPTSGGTSGGAVKDVVLLALLMLLLPLLLALFGIASAVVVGTAPAAAICSQYRSIC